MTLLIRGFPWSAAALGAVVFTALRYAASGVAGWLGAPAEGAPLDPRALPLNLLAGLVISAGLTWIVLSDGDGTTTGRALRRAVLFCVIPVCGAIGASATGSVDATRAWVLTAAAVLGSLVTAALVAARVPARG